MHVVSLNVNGIRAAIRRGLLGWVAEKRPELICLQEIRATQSQLPLREFEQLGYESIWNLGSRPGYSGVGILSRIGFEPVADLLDDPGTEHEGRFLAVRAGETVVANSYVPNGNSGPERLAVKLTHLRALRDWTTQQLAAAGRLLLAGDFNIAAEPIDVSPADAPDRLLAERTGSVRRTARPRPRRLLPRLPSGRARPLHLVGELAGRPGTQHRLALRLPARLAAARARASGMPA